MDLDYFPIFINMNQKQVVVFGGGAIAARRVKVLLEFGAKVQVVAPEISKDLQKLAVREDNLTLEYRRYQPGELRKADNADLVQTAADNIDLVLTAADDIDLVLAATDDEAVNDSIFQECRQQGILVNTASDREKCDFYFPGIARKGEITVGVTANGQNHKKAGTVTRKIREILDQFF